MSSSFERRGFLRGLASLPLIGGGITLIGAPTKAAVPITDDLLWTYGEWLWHEHAMLQHELRPTPKTEYGGLQRVAREPWQWHYPSQSDGRSFASWSKVPAPLQPSARAAVVLAAVGCFEPRPEPEDEETWVERYLNHRGILDPKERSVVRAGILREDYRKGSGR
jgi:hypothetical protein